MLVYRSYKERNVFDKTKDKTYTEVICCAVRTKILLPCQFAKEISNCRTSDAQRPPSFHANGNEKQPALNIALHKVSTALWELKKTFY